MEYRPRRRAGSSRNDSRHVARHAHREREENAEMTTPSQQRDVPVPFRMAQRPRDERGYVIPFFVGYHHGKPDFRTIAPGRVAQCYRGELCWLCGQRLGKHRWFVVGPMCVANHLSSEPPSHYECARYACEACPHLTLPSAKRRTANLPEDAHAPPGIPLARNPGVVVMWESRNYHAIRTDGGGMLFNIGDPHSAPEWWTEGRHASRAEAEAGFDASVAVLREVAAMDARNEGSDAATATAERSIELARRYLPAEEGQAGK